MYALDFEYDGQYLSDYGFIVCDFNSPSGADIVSAGSKITFNTVQQHRGNRYGLTGTKYDEYIQTTFHICKNPDICDEMRITNDEYRDLMRWLNRKEFLPFQVLHEDDMEYDPCYFDASFNIGKIEINKILYGLELTMETNRPFGYWLERSESFNITAANTEIEITDSSDEVGYIYPDLIITCGSDGDLVVKNQTIGVEMVINNCTHGEIITVHGEPQIITSSLEEHKLYNDFNFEFFKIGNSFEQRKNSIVVSLPCNIVIKYRPIIKDAP